jgi:hypothetical protein
VRKRLGIAAEAEVSEIALPPASCAAARQRRNVGFGTPTGHRHTGGARLVGIETYEAVAITGGSGD